MDPNQTSRLYQQLPDVPTTQPIPTPTVSVLGFQEEKRTPSYILIPIFIILFVLFLGGLFAVLKYGLGMDIQLTKSGVTPTAMITPTQVIETPTPIPPTPIVLTSTPTPTPTFVQLPTLLEVDGTWNLYKNPKEGFSMRLPKLMASNYGDCQYSEKDGDHSYRPVISMVPVVAMEGSQGVFITQDYYYALGKETKENSVSYFGFCDKVQVTADNLEKVIADSLKGLSMYVPSNWQVKTKKIYTDLDLEQFIKSNYGSGCSIGSIKVNQNGYNDVSIKGDGMDMETTKCLINYKYVLKYSEQKQIAATWGVGQAIVFSGENFQPSYDQLMIDSFRFL